MNTNRILALLSKAIDNNDIDSVLGERVAYMIQTGVFKELFEIGGVSEIINLTLSDRGLWIQHIVMKGAGTAPFITAKTELRVPLSSRLVIDTDEPIYVHTYSIGYESCIYKKRLLTASDVT